MGIERNKVADDETVIDLSRLVKAVWKKAWLLVLIALLFGSVSYLGTRIFIAPTYRSSFTAYINNKAGVENSSLTNSDVLAAQSLVNTYSAIMVSEPVLADAAEQANVTMSYEELAKAVTTSTVDDTEIIQVDVTLKDPEMAQALAQALADIAPGYISTIVDGSSMQVVAPPRLPDEIFGPNYLKNTVIGFLLGVIIVVAVVVIKELVDDRVKGESDLEERYGIAVMGVIPDLVEAKRKNIAAYSYK